MTRKKKNQYIVKCVVNMDASKIKTIIIKTTKSSMACKMAETELRNNGFFHARAISCVEMP